MGYLVPPSNGSDYARFYIQENEKTAIFITEAEAVRNGDDTGYVVFAKVWAIGGEYRGKDDAKIEKYPHIFFELHDKPYKKTDWKTKTETTVEPSAIEVFLCQFLSGNSDFNDISLIDGFKGKLALGDYETLIDILPDLSDEKRLAKLVEIIDVEPAELSDEFKGKKKPALGGNGSKSGYRGSSAQKESEKLAERASFIATFFNPEAESGIYSEQHQKAMAVLYPQDENGGFKHQHYRNYLALILGSSSVM